MDPTITLTSETTLDYDQVNNPVHYNHSNIECIGYRSNDRKYVRTHCASRC